MSDEQAILVSDIFPTGWFGAELAAIKAGHTLAVFGCGPVGQFAIASAKLMGAGRIIAVDHRPDRLDAWRQGAEIVDYGLEDPVKAIVAITGGIGVDSAIDSVGVDSEHDDGSAGVERERSGNGAAWIAGDAPSLAINWAVEALAKAGTLSIVGVYPPTMTEFPIGAAMNKNLTIRMGNFHHRKYVPQLLNLIASGTIDPLAILTKTEPIETPSRPMRLSTTHARNG